MHYVLMDTDEAGGGTPIGVFDSPEINDDVLAAYFGAFTTVEHMDIRDSGLEWQKTILAGVEVSVLTLHYFSPNEI